MLNAEQANMWRQECVYCQETYDSKNFGSFNGKLETFLTYLSMQINAANKALAFTSATYLQEIMDEALAKNPAWNFKGHKILDELNDECPFSDPECTYLLLCSDYNNYIEAYELEGYAPMDLEQLILATSSEIASVDIEQPATGGQNYAAIITDGSPSNSFVVWTSCDYYLTLVE